MSTAKRILMVDDEEDFLLILKSALELRGFEVVTATNAVEAGIALATKKPALILMDIKMPGINGFQACEAIKRNPLTKDIPIIIISALSDDSNIKKATKMGLVDYFVKPIDMERLIKKIREVLNVNQ